MSQIVGYKRLSTGLSLVGLPSTAASVDRADHKSNGALCVSTYTGPMGRIVDAAGGGVTYTGEVAPGHTGDVYDEPIWRISRVTVLGNITTTEWACIPASAGVLARFAGFDHIWDDRATLTYM